MPGDGARSRGRTGTAVKPRDFKSLVSTNFTIRADCANFTIREDSTNFTFRTDTVSFTIRRIWTGGASRSRTGLNGFAGRGITALLSRL